MDYKKLSEKATKFLNSPEGKKSVDDFFIKQQWLDECLSRRIQMFHSKYKDRTDEVLEKLMSKYYSDEYRNKEYRLGFEPREPLLWFMLDYAKLHGTACEDEKYFNDFTSGAYYLGSYVVQVMVGQGAVIRIDKI